MKTFTPPDAAGMRDYYDVYLKHEAQLTEHLLNVCDSIPSLKAVLQQLTPEQLKAQQAQSREQLEQAIVKGNWQPLLEAQKQQGATYAAMDIPFRDWFLLIGAFQRVFYPHLTNAYGSDPDRLARVLTALSDYVDQTLSGMGDEYLKTKEKHHRPAGRGDSRAVDAGAAGARPAAAHSDRRRARHRTARGSSPRACSRAIRANRAKVVVIDITGVATIDSKRREPPVPDRRRGEADGRHVIVTGLSAEVAAGAGGARHRRRAAQHRRRPAGRPRGGRAPARYRVDRRTRRRGEGDRCRSRSSSRATR